MKIDRIVLIIPPDDSFREINTAIPSLGVAILCGYMKTHGYDISVVDFGRLIVHEPALRGILSHFHDRQRIESYIAGNPDRELLRAVDQLLEYVPCADGTVYAFSMDLMPKFTKNGAMLTLARELSGRCRCVTVAGGLLYTEGFFELMATGHLDYCISSLDLFSYCGHGAFLALCGEISKPSPSPQTVPGLIYMKDGALTANPPRDIDTFAPPDFSVFDLEKYRTRVPAGFEERCSDDTLVLPFRFSAGCEKNCGYCYNSRFREHCHLDISETIAQLCAVVESTGCRNYIFLNSCLNMTPEFTSEFAAAINDSGLDIRWSDCAMFENLDEEKIESLAAAGCIRLYFGFESLTRNIRRYVTKRLDLPQIVEVMELCRQYNIWVGLDIITGFPHETQEEVARLAGFLRGHSPLIDSITINKFMLYPHTAFYDRARSFGILPRPAGSLLEMAAGVPFDEEGGRRWEHIRRDTDRGAALLAAAFTEKHGYCNDAEMLPLLFGIYDRCGDKRVNRRVYAAIIGEYVRGVSQRYGPDARD